MERHATWSHRPYASQQGAPPYQGQQTSRSMDDSQEASASLGNSMTSNSGSTGAQRGSPTMFRRVALMPGKDRNWRDKHKEIPWAKTFCAPDKKKKRVLLVDYIKTDITESGKKQTKMEAKSYEFSNMVDLETMCSLDRKDGSILRVFHVQNFPEAIEFFVLKYRMYDPRNSNGWDSIKDWVYNYKPQRRAGKPMPMAKTFKRIYTQGLSKVAWGMDCLKVMRIKYREDSMERNAETKVAELMGFRDENILRGHNRMWKPDNPWMANNVPQPLPLSDTDPDNPRIPQHTHDVYSQRLSVYLQWLTSPDARHQIHPLPHPSRRQPTDIIDSGASIIIFDNSASLSIEDTVIPAHGEEERLWRGPGTSYYDATDLDPADELDPSEHENKFALDFIQKIIETIFDSVARSWEQVLDVSWDHTSILQDKIYETPADESRAPELFKNAEVWLKFGKLMKFHVECVGDVQEFVGDFRDEEDSSEGGRAEYTWLYSVEQTFQRLLGYIQEDLINQTDKLEDLMYKSVGIRDSRDSLRLSESMWRLSWITFIFLPLTFVCGFFGMNVNIFQNNPDISWYFIATVPFMTLVFIGLYFLKVAIARHHPQTHDRGSYEALFTELQKNNADMWCMTGPREGNIKPIGWRSKLKWFYIRRWTYNKAIYKSGTLGVDEQHTTGWTQFKKWLITKWTLSGSFKYRTLKGEPSILSTSDNTTEELLTGTREKHTESPPPMSPPLTPSLPSNGPDPTVSRTRWKRRHSRKMQRYHVFGDSGYTNSTATSTTSPRSRKNTTSNTTDTSSSASSFQSTKSSSWRLSGGRDKPADVNKSNATDTTMTTNGTIGSSTSSTLRESPVDITSAVMDRIPSTIKENEVKQTIRYPSSVPLARQHDQERQQPQPAATLREMSTMSSELEPLPDDLEVEMLDQFGNLISARTWASMDDGDPGTLRVGEERGRQEEEEDISLTRLGVVATVDVDGVNGEVVGIGDGEGDGYVGVHSIDSLARGGDGNVWRLGE